MYIKVPVEKRWPRQTVTQGDFNKGISGRDVGRSREIPRICYGGVVVAMAASEKSESELLGQQEAGGRAGGGLQWRDTSGPQRGPHASEHLDLTARPPPILLLVLPGPNPTGSKGSYGCRHRGQPPRMQAGQGTELEGRTESFQDRAVSRE